MILNGEYVEKLTDEELCMLEQLTYLDEDVAIAAGIDNRFTKINEQLKTRRISEILSVFNEEALNALKKHGEAVGDAVISGVEWARIIEYLQTSRLQYLVLNDIMLNDNNYHSVVFDKDLNKYVPISEFRKEHEEVSDDDLSKYDIMRVPLALCFTDGSEGTNEAIIAYKGTTGPDEWADNVYAGYNYSSPPQEAALKFAEDMVNEGFTKLTVTGHSKGSNKAMFVTILCNNVVRCVGFDGEGFSEQFLRDEDTVEKIVKRASLITNYSLSSDFVNILLYQIPGSNQIHCKGYGVDSIGENHSPNAFFVQVKEKDDMWGYVWHEITSQSFINDGEGSVPVATENDYSLFIKSGFADKYHLAEFRDGVLQFEIEEQKNELKQLHGLVEFLLSQGDEGEKILKYVHELLPNVVPDYDNNGNKVTTQDKCNAIFSDLDGLTNLLGYLLYYINENNLDSSTLNNLFSALHANTFGSIIGFFIDKLGGYVIKSLTDENDDYSEILVRFYGWRLADSKIDISDYMSEDDFISLWIGMKYEYRRVEYNNVDIYTIYDIDDFLQSDKAKKIAGNDEDYIELLNIENIGVYDLEKYKKKVKKLFEKYGYIVKFGNSGNNIICSGSDKTIIFGGAGPDILYGNSNDDIIYGGYGSDVIVGGAGDDIIYSSAILSGKSDIIYGGDGNDTIYAGSGDDVIHGDDGNDSIHGDYGDDHIYGGSGDDWIYGGEGNDTITAGSGNDHVWGDAGDDEIHGSSGYNYLFGGKDNDTITGGIETDNIWGGDDNDTLDGNFGDDTIFGGNGNDTLDGGYGTDYLYGGNGCDTYIITKDRKQNYIFDTYGYNFLYFKDIVLSELDFVLSDTIEDALDIKIKDTDDVFTLLKFNESYENYGLKFDDISERYIFVVNEDMVAVELDKRSIDVIYKGTGLDKMWGKVQNNSKGSQAQKYQEALTKQPPRDPLVIDFSDNDSASNEGLVDTDNGVYFDLDNNGFAEKTAWIDNGKGFLAYDRNGNGIIDNGSELFGDSVIMSNGQKSAHGFEALADLDSNNDGIIDENDTEFHKLLVWQDTLRNGKTDTGELKTLKELGIKSISLTTENKNHKTESGTIITDSAEVRFTDNRTTEIAEHWFEAHSYDSQELNIEGDGISLTSFGNMPSLSNALAADESGELSLLIEAFKNADDFAEKRIITKKILYFITGASEILSDSRGGAVDARDMHVIETIMGVDSFIGADGNTTPNSNAIPILKELYVQFENLYLSLLDDELGKTGYIEYLEEKVDENGNIVIDSEYIDITIENAALHGNNVEKMIFSIGSYLKTYDKACDTNCFAAFKEKYSEYAETLETIINADSVLGTIENDTINGTNSSEIIWGDSGNDTINAGGGNDIIYGGTGDDILNGGNGDDTYYFEKNHGNDIIHDTEGNNKLVFTDGISADDYDISIDAKLGFVLTHKETGETISMPDFLTNPLNYNFVFEGESQIEGGIEDREVIEGTNADDYLEAGDGFNIFYGGEGNDTLAGGKDMDFMYGGDGDDLLLGRNGVNVMFGGNGNDTIYDGDDGSYLSGGDGDDFLYGGGGADVLDGGAGNDYLQGDHGGDTYIFGRGYDTDTVNASSDLNTIIIHNYRASSMINTRNAHNDLIINFGSADSTDCLIIDHFFDYNSNRDFNFVFDDGTVLGQYDITAKYAPIYGTDGDDWLAIQNGDNGIIHGGAGNDGLSGGSGNDELYGEDDDDTLYGNDGNDILDGGTGNDTLCGGNGTDTYIFAKGYGNDTINEWGSDHSIVKLTDVNSDEVTITDQWGSNLVVSINGTEDTLIISNFKWGQATYSFEFADGAIASINKDTWELEFSKMPDIPETNEDELVQENADILSEIYADDSLTSDILTETDSTVISDISDSVSVTDESDEVADQTDIQVMILTENMSAFADEDNVFDNADVLNSTDDMSMMNQLLVGSQVQ